MTDTLADRIERAHQAPEGFADIQHISNIGGESINLTAIIRELQARLAVAREFIVSIPDSVVSQRPRIGIACVDLKLFEFSQIALTATDLAQPFEEGK